MTKRARGSSGTNWWDEGAPVVAPVQEQEPRSPEVHESERIMPHRMLLRVQKRVFYLEDQIAKRRRDGQATDYYQHEMEGIIWLMKYAGIVPERGETMGMPNEKFGPAPEPVHLTAMEQAMTKSAESQMNARDFLEAACKLKVSYAGEAAARRALVRLQAEQSPEYHVQHAYACAICHGWHLTSLDAEHSAVAQRIVESRRPECPERPPLPMSQQREIVAAYCRGKSLDALAASFKHPRRAIVNVLIDAGYAAPLTRDVHREKGIPG